MTETLQLLHDSLPFVILALLYAVWHRASNSTISMTWASRTHEPERDQKMAKLKMERDEARRIAEEMRGGLP